MEERLGCQEREHHTCLIRLIRRIANEEAWEAMDEHLIDYEHTAKPTEDTYT